jgi:hypothetical protein
MALGQLDNDDIQIAPGMPPNASYAQQGHFYMSWV